MDRSPVAIVNPVDVEETPSWLRAMVATFLDDPSGSSVERWTRVVARTWEPARAWGARDRGRRVATLRTETRTLTVPGTDGGTRELRADAVTNLTVSATHRRRGLMRQMLDGALCAARARGDAVSILISAEWPIYGRFGYAPATWSGDYVLHRNRRGAVPAGDPARVRASDAQEIAAVGAGVFTAFRRQRAGQVDRDQRWWDIALGQDGFPAPTQDAGLPHKLDRARGRRRGRRDRRLARDPAGRAQPAGRSRRGMYLGGVGPAELVCTEALTERTPGALERTRLMFSTPQPPWNATGFLIDTT